MHCRVVCEMPNCFERVEMDTPRYFATLSATLAMFAADLKLLGRTYDIYINNLGSQLCEKVLHSDGKHHELSPRNIHHLCS